MANLMRVLGDEARTELGNRESILAAESVWHCVKHLLMAGG